MGCCSLSASTRMAVCSRIRRRRCRIPYSPANLVAITTGNADAPESAILYVDITPISEIAVYRYDERGVLSFVRTVADSGAAPCWAVVNHAGTRLYATNTGDNSIAVYDLTDPLDPVEIQHFVMDATTGAPFSTVIDQSDEFLYVSSELSSANSTPVANAFHTLKVNPDGTLTEPFSPTVLPIGGSVPVRAQGISVFGTK